MNLPKLFLIMVTASPYHGGGGNGGTSPASPPPPPSWPHGEVIGIGSKEGRRSLFLKRRVRRRTHFLMQLPRRSKQLLPRPILTPTSLRSQTIFPPPPQAAPLLIVPETISTWTGAWYPDPKHITDLDDRTFLA